MAKNFIQPGDVLDHVATAALASGEAFLIGSRLAVALGDAAIGDTVAVAVKGVYSVPKLSTDVIPQGTPIYWDDTNNRLTLTDTSNTLAGYAASAAASGDTTVNIALNA